MAVSVRTRNGKRKLKITEDLTIYEVAEFKQKLFANLDKCKELAIDLAGVAELDNAGLQLLTMSKREFGRLEKPWSLVNHSKPVLDVLDDYHLTPELNQRDLAASEEGLAQ